MISAVESVTYSFSAVVAACCCIAVEPPSFSAVVVVGFIFMWQCCVLCSGSFPIWTCGELPSNLIPRPATLRCDPRLVNPLCHGSYGVISFLVPFLWDGWQHYSQS